MGVPGGSSTSVPNFPEQRTSGDAGWGFLLDGLSVQTADLLQEHMPVKGSGGLDGFPVHDALNSKGHEAVHVEYGKPTT